MAKRFTVKLNLFKLLFLILSFGNFMMTKSLRPVKTKWVKFNPSTETFQTDNYEAGGIEVIKDEIYQTYVSHCDHLKAFVPGKYCPKRKLFYYSDGGKEYTTTRDCELLAFPVASMSWVAVYDDSDVPPDDQLIDGGVHHNLKQYRICRFMHKWRGKETLLITGKYFKSLGRYCFAGLDKTEIRNSTFEILAKNMLGLEMTAYD